MAFLSSRINWLWRPTSSNGTRATLTRQLSSPATAEPSGQPGDGEPGTKNSSDEVFQSGKSVQFWRDWDSSSPNALRKLVSDLSQDIRENPTSLPYYTYCLGRSLFFALQGVLSLEMTPEYRRSSRRISTSSHFTEAGYAFRQDYKNIQKGLYKKPWDMDIRHRQSNPLFVGRNMIRFLQEARYTLSRRASQNPSADVWMDSVSFPDYYKKPFHFQGDGWMSSRSADVYDASTETLFVGRQDAMQRLALVAISDHLGEIDNRKSFKLLELGAGTGRVATFVLDNFPNIDYIVNDLSPFYLQKARSNIQYWERFRGLSEREGTVSYLQAPAENLPLSEESVDFILSVYLFHELPPQARREVAREAGRLLKPGRDVCIG